MANTFHLPSQRAFDKDDINQQTAGSSASIPIGVEIIAGILIVFLLTALSVAIGVAFRKKDTKTTH